MHNIPKDLLKNNSNYLKSCILYEVLSEKPIFECYRHFRERNGENAMGYGDFEYYYYRFYNGDVDFEHERRMDTNEQTLTGLPLEILGMVTGYLQPEERVHLRLTSKKLKAIVDMEPITFRLIAVEWTPNVFYLQINEKCFVYKNDVLKHPKLRVDRLDLILPGDLFPERKEQLLKCLPHSLHVKTSAIQETVDETRTIVSHLKPNFLKAILISGCPQELAPVFESEHWKQAKGAYVNSTKIDSKSFPLFYNLRCFRVLVTSMEMNDFHYLIANVAQNPSFQAGMIKAVTVTYLEVVEPFPMESRVENDGSLTFRYPIPNSSHYLEVKMGNDGVFTIERI